MENNEYIEHEIKVLDVDVESLKIKLEEIGAVKVYDDVRTIIALDTEDIHKLYGLDYFEEYKI